MIKNQGIFKPERMLKRLCDFYPLKDVIEMKDSIKTGLCFGLTSAIITTLGLIVGLHSFSGSKMVIIGGIVTIAIADAFSDALGIHVSEEAENIHKTRDVWESTFTTFLTKFLFALTFMIPVLLFELSTAILICIIYGLSMLSILSYTINKKEKWKVVLEHITIALIVVIITHYIGDWIAESFV